MCHGTFRQCAPRPGAVLVLAALVCMNPSLRGDPPERPPIPAYRDGRLDRLFYHPDRKRYDTPERHGLRWEDVHFKAGDGTALHGWFLPAQEGAARGTVVHAHGNAANVSAHLSAVAWLPARGFNVFLFDYRGFGHSEGVPGRRGLQLDLEAAVDTVRSRPDVQPDRLLLFGQSLGGAVALWSLGSGRLEGIQGLVTEGTFSSYRRIAGDAAGLLKLFTLGVSGRFSPEKVIDVIQVPKLLVHGTDDEVIPFRHGNILFKKAVEPKTFWAVEGGRHIDTFVQPGPEGEAARDRLVHFLDRCLEE